MFKDVGRELILIGCLLFPIDVGHSMNTIRHLTLTSTQKVKIMPMFHVKKNELQRSLVKQSEFGDPNNRNQLLLV